MYDSSSQTPYSSTKIIIQLATWVMARVAVDTLFSLLLVQNVLQNTEKKSTIELPILHAMCLLYYNCLWILSLPICMMQMNQLYCLHCTRSYTKKHFLGLKWHWIVKKKQTCSKTYSLVMLGWRHQSVTLLVTFQCLEALWRFVHAWVFC